MRHYPHAVLVVVAVGCVRVERPAIAYELSRSVVDLGRVTYEEAPPVGEVSLLNTGAGDFVATLKATGGDGAGYLLLPSGQDFLSVPVGSAATFEVSLVDESLGWVSGEYSSVLILEIGSFWDDPSTWGEDAEWVAESVNVPASFTLDCDLDLDGYAAEACAGDDCDDADDTTWPGAPEAPGDDADHNCDGLTTPVAESAD